MATDKIAFFRGINVGGKTIKMAELCQLFEQMGLGQVRSLLASGNLIFQSEETPEALRTKIEKELLAHYKSPLYVFILEGKDIEKILEHNPFPSQKDLHCYIFICEQGFAPELWEEFQSAPPAEAEKAQQVGDLFYWQVQKGSTLNTPFSKVLSKKAFRDKCTSRNLNTIEKVQKELIKRKEI